jgi:hypothetical protein
VVCRVVLPLALGTGACAHPPAPGGPSQSILLACENGKPESPVSFPDLYHESLLRFDLPPGSHRLVRLWIQASGDGELRWAIYQSNSLEGPGPLVREATRPIGGPSSSSGRDGRWFIEDLAGTPSQTGVVWVGVKKAAGEPGVWANHADCGNYFVRSNDPKSPLGLLPVKRNPHVRLEIEP